MRKCIAPVVGALTLFVLLAPTAAQAKSKYADVRVVTNAGETLADLRQYTNDVKVKASEAADCFGPSNPSSNDRYKLNSPNVLGALIDASSSNHDLKPLSITDAFVDDGFGFGVCDIGSLETVGFSYWYSSINGVSSSTGPDLIPVQNGDENLWYLTTGDEPGFPNELVLKAPARVIAGDPVNVHVTRVKADGTKQPAVGADLVGAAAETDIDGNAVITLSPGTTVLSATDESDDAPAADVAVCAAEALSDCPKKQGIDIFGSDGPDTIKSEPGPDRISCGKGKDVVKGAQKGEFGDEIASDCEKVKRA